METHFILSLRLPFHNPTKTCNTCKTKSEELSLKDRQWTCPKCNTHHDRDINAAKNIKSEGIRILKAAGHVVTACGDQIRLAEASVGL